MKLITSVNGLFREYSFSCRLSIIVPFIGLLCLSYDSGLVPGAEGHRFLLQLELRIVFLELLDRRTAFRSHLHRNLRNLAYLVRSLLIRDKVKELLTIFIIHPIAVEVIVGTQLTGQGNEQGTGIAHLILLLKAVELAVAYQVVINMFYIVRLAELHGH